jgi:hypothetical protein
MRELIQAALEVQTFMEQHSWRFCFIGGLAIQRWGQPRLTKDFDFSLLTGFSGEEDFVDTLLERYSARHAGMREFALRNRVMMLQSLDGVPFDVSLAALPYEEAFIGRATKAEFAPECLLRTCSAEDLIVLKAFANRAIDWMDIQGVVIRQDKTLNVRQIIKDLTPLIQLKESPEILDRLRTVLREEGIES